MAKTEVLPHDSDAERALLGAALMNRAVVEYLATHIDPSDFYLEVGSRVFAAIQDLYDGGNRVDVVTVGSRLSELGFVADRAELSSFTLDAPALSIEHAQSYADIVKTRAEARRAIAAVTNARTALYGGKDPFGVADGLLASLGNLDRVGSMPSRYWRNIDPYLDRSDDELAPWVIEGIVYLDGRVIVIATEKSGKSVALRMIGYCAASGLHPFRLLPIPPVRVLILDAENPDREMVYTGRALRRQIQKDRNVEWHPENIALFSRPFHMDLRRDRDRHELERVIEDFQPQLVIGGPVYKLLPQKAGESDVLHADTFTGLFDDLRGRYNFGLIIEHHMPIGDKTGRPGRAMGGQRWPAWADVTIYLKGLENGDLEVEKPHPTRGVFDWPVKLERGRSSADYPWIATHNGPPQLASVGSPAALPSISLDDDKESF